MNEVLDANYRNLERVISWIQNADLKASIILAFNGSLVLIVISESTHIYTALYNSKVHLIASTLILLSLGILVFSFIFSIFNALKVMLPDVKVRSEHKVFFFGTIPLFKRDEFRDKMIAISKKEIVENLIEQTYINSEIASNKFNHLNLSWKFLAASIFFSIVLAILVLIFKIPITMQ